MLIKFSCFEYFLRKFVDDYKDYHYMTIKIYVFRIDFDD